MTEHISQELAPTMNGNNLDDYRDYRYDVYRKLSDENKEDIKRANLARAKQGRKKWNAWAKALQKIVGDDVNSYIIDFSKLEIPAGLKCRGYHFPSLTLFTQAHFNGRADFREAQFGGRTYFRKAQFSRRADFKKAQFSDGAHFSEAQFSEEAYFKEAQFGGRTYFKEAQFSSQADFSEAQFSVVAYFSEAQFSREARFSKAQFSHYTDFNKALFRSHVYFNEVQFNDYAGFSEVLFCGDALFNQTAFTQIVNFQRSKYRGEADWRGGTFGGNVSFEQAAFTEVPDFNFASFVQPPHLSNIQIPKLLQGSHLIERFRKLKKMAIESNDHENELLFYGYETHAIAYLHQTPLLQKILIKLYHLISNFGYSIRRPLISLALFLCTMFCFNAITISPDAKLCQTSKAAFANSLLVYTLSNSLPVITMEKQQADFVKECLFGTGPLTTKHSLWRAAHIIPTALFLFLFGLAVRNRFKIK